MSFRNNTLAIVDQAIISLGNFATAVLLARVLAPFDYGMFAVLFGTMLLLNSIHAAVVIYPLSLEAAVARPSDLARTISSGFVMTVLLVCLEWFGLGFSCLRLQRWNLIPVTTIALLLWQLQETCRRGLAAQFRFREALYGDVVSYTGQFLGILLLWRLHQLSLFNIFGVMAATSLAALVMQASKTGWLTPSLAGAHDPLARYLRLARWAVLSHLAAMVPAVPMYVCLLGMFFTSKDAAVMQALGNILGVTNPIMLAMVGLIVPGAARALADKGQTGAWKCARKCGTLFAMLVLPYYLLLFIVPGLIVFLFYGRNSHYLGWASLLRWLALSYGLTYVAQVIGGFLRAIERMQVDFAANVIAAMVALASFIIGARHYDPLASAASSFALATASRTAILWWWSIRITRAAKRAQVPLVATV